MNDLLEKYENYCHLNDKTSSDVYYNLLSKIIPLSEIMKFFPPKISEEQREQRKAYQYLYLWDCLFFKEGFQYNAEYLWKNEEHRISVISNIRESIKEGIDDFLYNILFSICYHWPEIRDMVYTEDGNAFNTCESAQDYKRFIDEYPNTYKEFLLAAQYKYSLLTHSVFNGATEVLKLFPDSRLIPVDEIKQRCVEINGFYVLFNDEVLQDNELKEYLYSFLSSFNKVEDTADRYLIKRCITKEDYLRIMSSHIYQHVNIVVLDKSETHIGRFNDFSEFANRLSFLTGLRFSIADIELLSRFPNRIVTLGGICEKVFNLNDIGEWTIDSNSPKLVHFVDNSFTTEANGSFGMCRVVIM